MKISNDLVVEKHRLASSHALCNVRYDALVEVVLGILRICSAHAETLGNGLSVHRPAASLPKYRPHCAEFAGGRFAGRSLQRRQMPSSQTKLAKTVL
jgi:hypothetical protein